MKRDLLSPEFKHFNAQRSQRAMQKLQKKNHVKTRVVRMSKFVSKIIVAAPIHFSIVDNPQETLEFFDKIYRVAYLYRQLYINIKRIEQITPDSILYLLLFLEITKKDSDIRISGNAPENEKCRALFLNSGFYDFVNSKYKTIIDNAILTVKSDNLVDGIIANEVIDFASDKLHLQKGITTRAFYTTILECMGNTRQHAYNTKRDVDKYHIAKYAKWWLIAHFDTDSSKIRFAILDNGKGIPETVRKKIFDKILPEHDSQIIKSALNGEFRTSTALRYRGKGLPKIKSFYDSKVVDNLIVVSNNGYFNADNNVCNDIGPMFKGTMICWSFISEEKR